MITYHPLCIILSPDTNVPYYFNGGVFQGIAFEEITDKNLKWEITNEFDLGLDFTVLTEDLPVK